MEFSNCYDCCEISFTSFGPSIITPQAQFLSYDSYLASLEGAFAKFKSTALLAVHILNLKKFRDCFLDKFTVVKFHG